MKDKVEVYNDYVLKHNTSKFSNGLEWLTELLSINHRRELRVYQWYRASKSKELLIPKIYEYSSTTIKLEKLEEIYGRNIDVNECIPSLKEFTLLGAGKKLSISDYLSSPTQSVLRGLISNAKFLGSLLIFRCVNHLFKLNINKPRGVGVRLIHRDLKKDQNMMRTKDGIYFIDFGSSILTKDYFLTDIVELSSDFRKFEINFHLIAKYASELGFDKRDEEYLRSQIYLLLMRRCMHFHPVDQANKMYMQSAKKFMNELELLVKKFTLENRNNER